MANNLTAFVDRHQSQLGYPESHSLSAEDITAFDIASNTPSVSPGDELTFDIPNQWISNQGLSHCISNDLADASVAALAESLGLQGHSNTKLSSHLKCLGSPIPDANVIVPFDDGDIENWGRVADFAQKVTAPALSNKGNAVGRAELQDVDTSISTTLGDLSFNVGREDFGFEGLHHPIQSEHPQPLLAVQPRSIASNRAGQDPIDQSQLVSKLLERDTIRNDLILLGVGDHWSMCQPTHPSAMMTQIQHENESSPRAERCKSSSRSRLSPGSEVFKCPVCKVFSGDIPSLIEHMRCHNRSHVCQIQGCTRRFSTSRDLTRHTKSAHSNTALTCSICLAVIKGNRMDNLQRHIRNRHSSQAMVQASAPGCSSWPRPGDYISM